MSEFIDYLHEVLREFGAIRTRKMFGGYGVYHNDLMFALVADNELYFKVDEQCRALFEEQGSQAFEYSAKNNKIVKMSYYSAPQTIFDDPDDARVWAEIAFQAALRSKR